MFEKIRIKIFGDQPTPKITDKILDRIIQKDYPGNFDDIKRKLELIDSDTKKGKNRLSAAVLKLAKGDFSKIDTYVEMCNNDFRDVVLEAENPRVFKEAFDDMNASEEKKAYMDDWTDYSNWLHKY